MSNHLSIVNIVSDEHKDLINELAEILGMGPDSLSIKLQDSSGNLFWCCHSWWRLERYISFKDTYGLSNNGIDIQRYKPAINALYEFIINTEHMEEKDKIPTMNMQNALVEMGLNVVEED